MPLNLLSLTDRFTSAIVGNGFVGTLWLAFVLQTILIIWLIANLLSPHPFRYSSNTLAQLASMTTVLAAIGVNKNIYSTAPAQKALAAGWLVTAVVDILWVIYLSSEEMSPVRYTLDRGWGPGERRSSVDIAVEGPGEHAGGFGNLGRKLPPLTPPSFRLRSARLRKTKRDSANVPAPDSKIVEEGVGENGNAIPLTTPGSEGGVEGENRQSFAHRSVSVNPGASSVGGDIRLDSRPTSSAPSGGPSARTSARGSAGSKAKAQAMYSCTFLVYFSFAHGN